MLIDSNLLIYSLNSSSPKQKLAQEFLSSHLESVISQQNIFETLRILTHQKFPQPFLPNEALKAIQAITEKLTIIAPTYETPDLAFALIKKYQISGTEIFDAYLVATCLSNNITKIATDNLKHLQKYQELEVINPFA